MNYEKLKGHILKHNLKGKYNIVKRGGESNKLCVILAGYKKQLWPDVFGRIRKYAPADIDICILSSGLYVQELDDYAKEYGWSYLFSKRNNVCQVQNLAIKEFPKAEYIYKIDEDIFITEHMFEKLFDCYERVNAESVYDVGFVSPLLNVNAYSYVRILERYDLLDEYAKRFEKPKMIAEPYMAIQNSPDVALFMWGVDGTLPKIDEMNNQLEKDEFSYSLCPIRLSIGCIMFTRKFYDMMGGFWVLTGNSLGLDEAEMIIHSQLMSKAVVICENAVVGHLCFKEQNKVMMEYHKNHPDFFRMDN